MLAHVDDVAVEKLMAASSVKGLYNPMQKTTTSLNASPVASDSHAFSSTTRRRSSGACVCCI